MSYAGKKCIPKAQKLLFSLIFYIGLSNAYAVGGGRPDPDGHFKAAVRFIKPDCSGVKVSENIYLSAAHCFFSFVPFPQTVVKFDAKNPSLNMTSSSGEVFELTIEEIAIPPQYAKYEEQFKRRFDQGSLDQIKLIYEKAGQKFSPWELLGADQAPDLAIIRVKESTSVPIAQISLNVISEGRPITLTGYGPIYSGSQGVLFLSEQTRVLNIADAVLVSLQEINDYTQYRIIAKGGILKKIDGVSKRYGLISVDNIPVTLIPGDSGGPAFSKDQSGVYKVIGINSGVSSGKKSDGGYSNLARLYDPDTKNWICEYLKKNIGDCLD